MSPRSSTEGSHRGVSRAATGHGAARLSHARGVRSGGVGAVSRLTGWSVYLPMVMLPGDLKPGARQRGHGLRSGGLPSEAPRALPDRQPRLQPASRDTCTAMVTAASVVRPPARFSRTAEEDPVACWERDHPEESQKLRDRIARQIAAEVHGRKVSEQTLVLVGHSQYRHIVLQRVGEHKAIGTTAGVHAQHQVRSGVL